MARRLTGKNSFSLLLAAALWAVLASSLAPAAFAQDGPNRAALVLRFADGSVETQCVAFTEPFISGLELLTRAGVEAQMDANSGLGGAVCSIRKYGCAFPGQDCFCRCQGIECEYWAYYHWAADRWEYSQIGASGYRVTDGALEGWSWGPGNFSSGTEPPQITFDEVCAADPTPAAAAPQASARSVGDFLAPAVHAQGLPDAAAAAAQPAAAAVVPFTAPPGYAAYLLLLAFLIFAILRVADRKKKAAANAAAAARRGS